MPITDLTGYQWVANNSLSYSSVQSSAWENGFNISFQSNSQSFNKIYVDSDDIYDFSSSDYFDLTYVNGGNNTSYNFKSNQWTNDAYKTIVISGGTDATNSTLIAWLEANGTLTAPQPQPTGTNKISIGTTKLAKAFVGNSEVASMWLGNVKIYEKGSPTPTQYTNGSFTAITTGDCGIVIKIDGIASLSNYDYNVYDSSTSANNLTASYLTIMNYSGYSQEYTNLVNCSIETIDNIDKITITGNNWSFNVRSDE